MYREHLPTIREMFFKIDDRFRTPALNKISDSAGGVPVIGNANLVLVGVHVRRTDFVHSARREGGRLATGDYFRKAMEWFKRKYATSERRVMFVVVSDDMDWYVERLESAMVGAQNNLSLKFFAKPRCRQNFRAHSPYDVHLLGTHDTDGISKEESLGIDLAMMLECHHAILTHGTLGMWIGMLSRGDVVMADDAAMRKPLLEVQLAKKADLGWKFMDYT